MRRAIVAGAVSGCVLSSAALAQPQERHVSALAPSPSALALLAPPFSSPDARRVLDRGLDARLIDAQPSPWWAPLASAAVPGSGQLALKQWRGVGYFLLEAFVVVQHVRSNSDGRRERREYQRLARVARAPFSSTLPNGDQVYYERMLHHLESGVFDVTPGGAIDPDPDPATYNGSVWLLARRTYWQDPDAPPPPESVPYRNAEEFYLARAIRPEFRWSWAAAPAEMELFRAAVVRSNDAFRDAGLYLGAVLANHAISMVDAYVTVRLRSEPSGERAFGVEGSIPWAPFGRPSRRMHRGG
jgi:hypothetical protein